MSILVVCPKCQKKTKIEDRLRDKKIKCPGCSAVFSAEPIAARESTIAADEKKGKPRAVDKSAPERRPVKAPLDDEERVRSTPKKSASAPEPDDEDRPRKNNRKGTSDNKKKKNGVSGLLIGGILGGIVLILVAGGGAAYYFLHRGDKAVVVAATGKFDPNTPGKPNIPTGSELAALESEVKERHKAEYAKSEPAARKALASQLLDEGSGGMTLASKRYVCLREARDLALQAGDLTLAMRAADQIGETFASVKSVEMKAELLEAAARPGAAPTDHGDAAGIALAVCDEAVEADDYDAAERASSGWPQTFVADQTGTPVAIAVATRAPEIDFLAFHYNKSARDAAATLASNPKDPAANLAMGRFQALIRGDWDRGLRLLARGSDAGWKTLAQTDLDGPPNGQEAGKIADAYAARISTESEPAAHANLSCRAHYWYSQAAPNTTGEDQKRVTTKRDQFEQTLPNQRPIIIAAYYGTDTGWADVTTRMRSLLAQTPEEQFNNAVNLVLGVDPIPGTTKSLVIVYRYWDTIHVSTIPEGFSTHHCPNPLPRTATFQSQPYPRPGPPLCPLRRGRNLRRRIGPILRTSDTWEKGHFSE